MVKDNSTEMLKQIFTFLDSDNDGYINILLMKRMLNIFNLPIVNVTYINYTYEKALELIEMKFCESNKNQKIKFNKLRKTLINSKKID